MDDELESVADAENRLAKIEHGRVGGWSIGIINRPGAAGEDDAEGLIGLNFGDGYGAWQHHRKDVLFANATRDQLRVLRAKIEDNDCLGVHVSVWQGAGLDVKKWW